MIDQRFMQSLADDQLMPPEEGVQEMLLAAGPARTDEPQAFVGTRLNVPRAGQAQPTIQDRERLAVGLLDSLAGALRGAVAQTIGLPGDIRSIVDLIAQEGAEKYLGQRTLPTTEEILQSNMLPPVLKEGVPRREERQPSVETAEQVGTFLPAPGIPEAVKMAGRAIKATKGMPIGMSIKLVDGTDLPIDLAPKTTSKSFKNWFGDSKVVDESNKPIVVYHGTASDFSEFSKGLQGMTTDSESARKGFFFTSDREVARGYAEYAATYAPVKRLLDSVPKLEKAGKFDEADQAIIQAEQLEKQLSNERLAGQNIMPVYLSIKNPFVYDAKGAPYTDIEKGLTAIIDKAKKAGHDGVIFKNLDDDPGRANMVADHYVVFEPTQIKSAIGNVGTFDPKDPSIVRGVAVGGGGGAVATQEENQ